MNEILIHYDYNGGYFCRHHYMPLSPFGIGRSVDASVKDFIRKNFRYFKENGRAVTFSGYKLYLMDEQSEKDFSDCEITKEKIREWEDWANTLNLEGFIESGQCPHCKMMPFTPFTPSHYS